MTGNAINAKSDVLGERELDCVSGGMSWLPIVVAQVLAMIKGADGGTSGGGQDGPAQQFQQILQQVSGR
jgi:hypothetical protein